MVFYSFYFSSYHPAVNKTGIVLYHLSLSPLATWQWKYNDRFEKARISQKLPWVLASSVSPLYAAWEPIKSRHRSGLTFAPIASIDHET